MENGWREGLAQRLGNSGRKVRGGMVISYDSGREQEGQKCFRGKSHRI